MSTVQRVWGWISHQLQQERREDTAAVAGFPVRVNSGRFLLQQKMRLFPSPSGALAERRVRKEEKEHSEERESC